MKSKANEEGWFPDSLHYTKNFDKNPKNSRKSNYALQKCV